MTAYQLTLTTLSPLHIGDGDELRYGFDFVINQERKRTYRLNVDAILAAYGSRLTPDRSGNYKLPGELLTPSDLSNPDFFRYDLAGFPRSSKADARLKSCIKDVHDCAYIPGSSLKGALRTALAWTGWNEINPHLDRNAVGRSKFWAGQPLERKIFGPDPNHDLLRTLQVSDLTGSAMPGHKLVVVNAQVLTQRSAGSPVELEAVAGDAHFSGSLTIDDNLFGPMAERELGFSNRRHWLDELLPRVQKHSQARILKLIKWFEDAEGYSEMAKFYRDLAKVTLPENMALVQLGWGSGWDGKTFWTHLTDNPQLFEQLVYDFRMHKANRNAPPRRAGDPFPRSKRAAMKVVEGRASAVAPLGWVLLELGK